MDENNSLVDLDRNSDWLNRNPGFYHGGSLGLDYRLTPVLSVGVQGQFRQLGNHLGDLDPLSARNRLMSGGMSVVWHW